MMNLHSTKKIETNHKDLIQDIAFDFYGKRVATASLDHTVKIWNIDEKNKWVFKEELKINPGLNKVAWAHPEYGSFLAVACEKQVWIYEEASYGSGKSTQSGWIKRTPALSDARATITDLKFAPKDLGVQIVICAQNGQVLIYQCLDILSSNAWTLVPPELKTNMSSCSSCSWSNSFTAPTLLALGCDEGNSTTDKLLLYEHNKHGGNHTYNKVEKIQSIACTDPIRSLAFAPSIGKSNHTIAIASRSLMVSTIKYIKEPYKYQVTTEILDSDAWQVCWNTLGTILASAGDSRKVRLYKCNYLGSWKCFAEITGDSCYSTLAEQQMNEYEISSRNNEDAERHDRESIMSNRKYEALVNNMPSLRHIQSSNK